MIPAENIVHFANFDSPRRSQTGNRLSINACNHPERFGNRLKEEKLPLSVCTQMGSEYPDPIRLSNLLKACGNEKNIVKVRAIHAVIINKSLIAKDSHLATALLRAYAKCGALEKAHEIFEQILVKDVVSWTALIAGYADHDLLNEVLQCFRQMQNEGVSPDAMTYIYVLKVCSILRLLELGKDINAKIRDQGFLQKDVVLGNALIDMYSKCGALEKAEEVFEQLPLRNVVGWTALITGYVQHEQSYEALRCFRRMKDEGVPPNAVTYVCILKACGILGTFRFAEQIEVEVRTQGLLQKNVALSATLMDIYIQFGMLEKARDLFEHLPERNVVTWTVLIDGYVEHGLAHDALKCFRQMQGEGVNPNIVTYVCAIKACSIVGSLEIGEEIHVEVRKQGLLQKYVTVGNTLVDMYGKCGAVGKAQEVFNQLPVQDVVSWTTLIAGYVQHGFSRQALECFKQMQNEGVCPNGLTYACILKACGIVRSVDIGRHISAAVQKEGLLEKDTVLGTALVDMYAKCGLLDDAREALANLPVRTVASWNALIAGYIQHGISDEALKCLGQMNDDGICPDAFTYVCILKACGSLKSLQIGEDIDIEIRKKGLLEKDVVLGSSLVDMYAKCGALHKAQKIFQQLTVRSVVSWTTLIAGYAEHGLCDEVLSCFQQMQVEGVYPDAVSYALVLKVCSVVGSLKTGEDIDIVIRRNGLLQKDMLLGASLVDMYAKCGAVGKAHEVFELLSLRDAMSWCALMAGYGHLGQISIVIDLFRRMNAEGIMPDLLIFRALLTACSHAGLLTEGEKLFEDMCAIYCLSPTVEHYACMIDLFGRAGQFSKMRAFLDKVSSSNHLSLFLATLSACHKWVNVKLGRWAFEQSIQLDKNCTAAYISMQNIYAATGHLTEVDEILV